MPKYTLIELAPSGDFISLPWETRELFTQEVHRTPSRAPGGPSWFCYIPANAPSDVRLRTEARLKAAALEDIDREIIFWKTLKKGML